jgi:hypothetical protein
MCGYAPSRGVLEALRQIIFLSDALGNHACECRHPEMRRLPDGVFWCPACGSEVLPARSECHAEGAGTSRGHRQGSGVGIPETVPARKKSSHRRVMRAAEGVRP